MTDAEDYRRKAADCERDAAKMSFAPDRARLLEIAAGWRKLAEAAEDDERKRGE